SVGVEALLPNRLHPLLHFRGDRLAPLIAAGHSRGCGGRIARGAITARKQQGRHDRGGRKDTPSHARTSTGAGLLLISPKPAAMSAAAAASSSHAPRPGASSASPAAAARASGVNPAAAIEAAWAPAASIGPLEDASCGSPARSPNRAPRRDLAK